MGKQVSDGNWNINGNLEIICIELGEAMGTSRECTELIEKMRFDGVEYSSDRDSSIIREVERPC